MKKLLLTIGLLTAVAVGSSYGQGTLFFNNTGGTRVSTNSGPAGLNGVGLTAAAAGGFYYALFYSTTQTTVSGSAAPVIGAGGTYAFNASGWLDGSGSTPVYGTNGSAGRFAPSVLNTDGSYSVANLPGGTSAQYTIVGWSSNIGSTVSALQAWLANPSVNGWVGESAVSGAFAVGTLGSTPAATIFGASSPNIPGFVLGEVLATTPEPGTLALCALGGASMLLFRRKK